MCSIFVPVTPSGICSFFDLYLFRIYMFLFSNAFLYCRSLLSKSFRSRTECSELTFPFFIHYWITYLCILCFVCCVNTQVYAMYALVKHKQFNNVYVFMMWTQHNVPQVLCTVEFIHDTYLYRGSLVTYNEFIKWKLWNKKTLHNHQLGFEFRVLLED